MSGWLVVRCQCRPALGHAARPRSRSGGWPPPEAGRGPRGGSAEFSAQVSEFGQKTPHPPFWERRMSAHMPTRLAVRDPRTLLSARPFPKTRPLFILIAGGRGRSEPSISTGRESRQAEPAPLPALAPPWGGRGRGLGRVQAGLGLLLSGGTPLGGLLRGRPASGSSGCSWGTFPRL